eukprot:651477-Amorphochlora_amoeboformis.AAC.1
MRQEAEASHIDICDWFFAPNPASVSRFFTFFSIFFQNYNPHRSHEARLQIGWRLTVPYLRFHLTLRASTRTGWRERCGIRVTRVRQLSIYEPR